MKEFAELWNDIKNKLNNKNHIKNWTYYQWTKDKKGYLGEDFYAKYVGKEVVECYLKRGTVQRIPQLAFQILYKNWESYSKGLLPRSKLIEDTRFSKYTISIFHHMGMSYD